jgi:hypothetical protein
MARSSLIEFSRISACSKKRPNFLNSALSVRYLKSSAFFFCDTGVLFGIDVFKFVFQIKRQAEIAQSV